MLQSAFLATTPRNIVVRRHLPSGRDRAHSASRSNTRAQASRRRVELPHTSTNSVLVITGNGPRLHVTSQATHRPGSGTSRSDTPEYQCWRPCIRRRAPKLSSPFMNYSASCVFCVLMLPFPSPPRPSREQDCLSGETEPAPRTREKKGSWRALLRALGSAKLPRRCDVY